MTEYRLGPLSQIPPGEGREFVVGELRLAVFHLREGSVRATQAECPHRQGPLADGLLGNGVVVCPFHAWKFDLKSGLPVLGECALRVYPIRSDKGELVVTL